MVNKFEILEPSKLLTMVANATNTESSIRGRNQQIAAEALSRLVDYEQSMPMKGRAHIKDMKFTEKLIESLGRVMSEQPADEYSTLISKLWNYAETVAEIHENVNFLSPFFVANDHIGKILMLIFYLKNYILQYLHRINWISETFFQSSTTLWIFVQQVSQEFEQLSQEQPKLFIQLYHIHAAIGVRTQ